MADAKWDKWFLGLAQYVSTASKDPSTKVGVVIVDDERRVLGVGYNGFPRGVHDLEERLNDRPTKYSLVVHGEVNAVLNCQSRPVGATLYIWTEPSLPPCNECAKVVVQAGIKRVVGQRGPNREDWAKARDTAELIYREGGVQLEYTDVSN